MIQDVFLEGSTYAEPPSRFEAGTPAIAQAIGLGAACDYLTGVGMQRIHDYEVEIGGYLYDKVRAGCCLVPSRAAHALWRLRLQAARTALSTCLWFLSRLQLRAIDSVRIYGPPPTVPNGRAALVTFNVEGVHPTDLSTILDQVRAGVWPPAWALASADDALCPCRCSRALLCARATCARSLHTATWA